MKNILFVHKKNKTLGWLKKNFLQPEYTCNRANGVQVACKLLRENFFDVVVVDPNLIDGDYLDLVEYVHEISFPTRILVVYSSQTDLEGVTALRKGADEYVVAPFSDSELVLRIEKLLLRRKLNEHECLGTDKVKLDPNSGTLELGEAKRSLRKKESAILSCLLRYQNSVVSRDMLIQHVWCGESLLPSYATVDVYIRRLRVILGEHSSLIKTVRGFGYQACA